MRFWTHPGLIAVSLIIMTTTAADARPRGAAPCVPTAVHHVETWATQRETWLRTPQEWKLRRVDSVRDQRRLVDGKEG